MRLDVQADDLLDLVPETVDVSGLEDIVIRGEGFPVFGNIGSQADVSIALGLKERQRHSFDIAGKDIEVGVGIEFLKKLSFDKAGHDDGIVTPWPSP